MKTKIWKDKRKKLRWTLKAGNNVKIGASSQGYARKADLRKNMRQVAEGLLEALEDDSKGDLRMSKNKLEKLQDRLAIQSTVDPAFELEAIQWGLDEIKKLTTEVRDLRRQITRLDCAGDRQT